MSKSPLSLAVTNCYGNVDLTRTTLSRRYTHVRGKRLEITCRRLKIRYAKAVVSFRGESRYGFSPVFDGVVVSSRSAPKLIEAIRERDAKAARRKDSARQELSVLAALFSLNRRAKRCRDLAQTYYLERMHGFAGQMRQEKERIYALKGQALHHLVEEGLLKHEAYHQFGDGGNWSELLSGDGYTFHRPCPPQPSQEAEAEAEMRSDIDAKPKGRKEPTLDVAYEVVKKYLEGRPTVDVYHWPPQMAFRRRYRNDWDDDEWDDAEEEHEMEYA